MSLFSTILSKLGMGGASATSASQRGNAASADSAPPPSPSRPSATPVDIFAVLEQRAAANSQKLNWRTSIVDLMKLLDMDSSVTARKAEPWGRAEPGGRAESCGVAWAARTTSSSRLSQTCLVRP